MIPETSAMRFSTLVSLVVAPILATTVSALFTPTAHALTVTYEAPNNHAASPRVGTTQQVDFESLQVGANNDGYTVNFIDAATNHNYRATYDYLPIANYGSGGSQTSGAGYTGQFVANFNGQAPTNLTFTDQTNGGVSAGIRYFGMFYSSLDGNNQLSLYDDTVLLAQFTINNIPLTLNYQTGFVGGPWNEEGAFFNFYADGNEKITRVQFSQLGGGGFEHDNHTFRVPNAVVRNGTGVNLAGLNITGGSINNTVPGPAFLAGQAVLGVVATLKRRQKKAKAMA
jgi:hypothetical protein